MNEEKEGSARSEWHLGLAIRPAREQHDVLKNE